MVIAVRLVSNAASIYYPKSLLSRAIPDTNSFRLSFLETGPVARTCVLMLYLRVQHLGAGVRAKESRAGKWRELTQGYSPKLTTAWY